MLSYSIPFDASQSPTTSAKCKLHSKMFMESLKNFDLWALRSKLLQVICIKLNFHEFIILKIFGKKKKLKLIVKYILFKY